jgi:hypothetical protein
MLCTRRQIRRTIQPDENLICQKALGRDYDISQDRFYVYRARFSYPNKSCFFLIGCGHTIDDNNIMVVLYERDGDSMLAMVQCQIIVIFLLECSFENSVPARVSSIDIWNIPMLPWPVR